MRLAKWIMPLIVLSAMTINIITPVLAENSIKMTHTPNTQGENLFIFSAETPFHAHHKILPEHNEVVITIKGPEIGDALIKFFNNRIIYTKDSCIKNISVKPISDVENKITFLYSRAMQPIVEIKGPKTDTSHYLNVSIAPKIPTTKQCTALIAKEHNELTWFQRPLYFSGNIMLDTARPFNYRGTLDKGTLGFDDHWELRRLKFDVKGVHLNWHYQFRFDFSDTLDDEEIKLTRALVSYIGHQSWQVRFGLIPEPFGLENSTSSKYLTFMERAPLGAIMMEDNLGISASNTFSKKLYLQFGAFKERHYPGTSSTKSSITGRLSYTPLNTKGKIWYLGTSLSVRQPIDDEAKYKVRPDAHLANRIFRTSTMDPIDRIDVGNLELAFVKGPISAQAEYMQARHIFLDDKPDQNLAAAYFFASWFITGESRSYQKGTFGRIKPKRPYGKGWGAWELAARHSWLDDGKNEELKNVTLGLNWYLNKHVRFMANFVRTKHVTSSGVGNADIIQARGQYSF